MFRKGVALSPESCRRRSRDQQSSTNEKAEDRFCSTLMKVMPTTSPLLGGDLLNASIDTISASTRRGHWNQSAWRKHRQSEHFTSSLCGTWYVGELDLPGHRADLLLQLLVPETHHLPFEGGGQQLLLPGLTQSVNVTLRREAAEAVLHEGVRLLLHPGGSTRADPL